MLEYFYHRASKLNQNRILGVKASKFCHFTQRYNERHYVTILNL